MAQTEIDDHTEPKYKDEEWLRQKYVEEGLASEEVGDLCGVSGRCILNWMEKFGIERRSSGESQTPDARYTDEEWLREKYVDEKMPMGEIANECDCNPVTIFNWLHKFGIETRNVEDWSGGRGNGNWVEYANLQVNNNGYLVSRSSHGGDRDVVPIHRLAAVAWFGWDAVVGNECHHRIPIPWLNMESNVLPVPKHEHTVISGFYRRKGVPKEIVEDALDF